MRRRVVWIGTALILGLTLLGYALFSSDQSPPLRYRTVAVERGSVVPVVTATGTVNPVVAVQVGSQVSGYIKSLSADYNSVVTAGEVIAQIDPAPFQARREQAWSNLKMARAAVAKSKVDLTQKQRELSRMKQLFAQQFVSQSDIDLALSNAENAAAQLQLTEAQVKQAEATLSAAELDLKYTTIRSPVDGIVIARNVEVGQTVAASFATPNFFLIALDLMEMQVDTNVSEADIGGISEGRDASFTVDAYPNEVFHGKIRQVRNAPVAVQNVVTYNVVVGVRNDKLRLKPGMTANVSMVVVQRDEVLRVPNAAMRFTPPPSAQGGDGKAAAASPKAGSGGSASSKDPMVKTVWRLGPDDTPEPVTVQIGVSDGTLTEITTAELKEGDRIIVGLESLRANRGSSSLPPGFGSAQGRRGRDRGL